MNEEIETLDLLTEQLNGELTRIEAALVKEYAGVVAEVSLADGRPVPLTLRFCKHDGRWGLFIFNPQAPLAGLTSLASASRQARICTASVLPHLLVAIRDQLDAVRVALGHAICLAQAFTLTHLRDGDVEGGDSEGLPEGGLKVPDRGGD